MIKRCACLTAIAFLVLCVAGCRMSRQQVIGQYALSSQVGAGPTAIELRGNGTFTLYRPIRGTPSDWSGEGTWKLINQTMLGPGVETVYLTGGHFMGALPLAEQYDAVCLQVEKNSELWCKSK